MKTKNTTTNSSKSNIKKEFLSIKVYIEKDNLNKKIKLQVGKTTVKELLKELHILSSTSIITINDEVVTDDEIIKENDNIKILSVISGG